ncbi:DUF2163 domain-containing protein [Sphingomonas sp. SUN039]|nr:DUF2163 domain-containing protein [Sphingomonas sp. SUN039]UVO52976.1 DUF2163 domain-containing protein [Sphingomonas sp. SUN039]
MPDWYAQPLTTLAFLWRVERADGVALGFTSHDRDLTRDGFVYRAAPGMVPSAIRLSGGFEADDVDLDGALTSGAFTEDDLRAGRWDGARLVLSAVDWADADAEAVVLVRGTFGSVALRDGSFSVGLRGVASAFDAAVAEETSPSCRATLGDRRCRVDLAGRRHGLRVVAVAGSAVTLETGFADGIFAGGSLRWIDGPRAGTIERVLASAGTGVTLAEPVVVALSVSGPVAVELVEGCDRQLGTCRDRFANVANFRGEPHLPGNDLLTRYGG